MIWKKILSILIIIVGFQYSSATIYLGNYKKFRNENLESQHHNIQSKLLKFDTVDVKIKNDYFYQESLNLANDYYINLATSNYIDYYLYQGDLRQIIQLYQENLSHPRNRHLLSYIQLLSKFYIFFYNYGNNNECKYIISQIKDLKEHLPHKENLYANAIIKIYEGLIEDNNTQFDFQKKALLEAIDIIEYLKNELHINEYKLRLSTAYNHLGISYANNPEINNKNKDVSNKNEVNHAAALIRKAIRINADSNFWQSAIYKSNLAYINKLLRESEDAIYYGNRAIFYASKIKNNYQILQRAACNVADIYWINNMTNSLSFQEAQKMCLDNKMKYEADKKLIQDLITNIKHPEKIDVYQEPFLSKYIVQIVSLLLIIITITLFVVNYKKKSKLPK